jgi:hypothetical protein
MNKTCSIFSGTFIDASECSSTRSNHLECVFKPTYSFRISVWFVDFSCLCAVASWSLTINLASRDVCGKFVEGSGGDGKDEHSFA